MVKKKINKYLRKTRSIRLSDRAWDSLEALAVENGCSRGQLLEIILNGADPYFKAHIKSTINTAKLRELIESGAIKFS